MALSDFESYELIGDCGTFTLEYWPKGGKPQRLQLDAENEDDALFEASHILECEPEDLEVSWR